MNLRKVIQELESGNPSPEAIKAATAILWEVYDFSADEPHAHKLIHDLKDRQFGTPAGPGLGV